MAIASTTLDELVRDLEHELGPGVVTRDGTRLGAYGADTYWPALAAQAQAAPLGVPDLAVTPEREEDVATCVRLANRYGVPVIAWGGGSGSQGGAVAERGGLILDLRSLDRLVEVDEDSMTVTVQAGKNGRALEDELNARGLMFPHYPASADLATVGGYVAARGSGVLSTRYGKIEDLVLSLRVVLPTGELVDMLPVPRHAVGPELTQLFVGSEGTLGIVTRVTFQVVPLPEERRFEAVSFPSLEAGIAAIREAMVRGFRPSVVRMYDEVATRETLAPVVGEELSGVCTLLAFEGDRRLVEAETAGVVALAGARGASVLDSRLGETWWSRRYDFYKPPHHPQLPAIWGTMEAVATYRNILGVYRAIKQALDGPYADHGLRLRIHLSHWYPWGTMLYGRFVVPDGGPEALELHDRIWDDGVRAILSAGGLMNDHHGVGLKLAPFMREQHGAALDLLARIKSALDPNGVMNPGKLGL